MRKYLNLCELIDALEEAENRELSDEYLNKIGAPNRNEVDIGEYSYGIMMCPIEWVLPYLKELKQLKGN